jgi:hypothetical protein
MKRYLCWLAVLAVAAVPDWASAYHRCGWPPPPCGYVVGPVSYPPVVYVPVYQPPMAPPKVYIAPAPAAPDRGETPATPQAAAPAPEPEFRPAGGKRTGDALPTPAPAPAAPPTPAPKAGSDETIPPLKLPGAGPGEPKPAAPAVPKAAPAPPPDTGSLTPPITPPKAPAAPASKPPIDPGDLPPLTLPPDGGPSTSKASPITASRSGPKVRVFTAEASGAPTTATRKVGFFNHTGTDLELVIEGKAVKLPKKTYLHAEVPPTFTWKHGTGSPESATVPPGAAGLDVVFRDE